MAHLFISHSTRDGAAMAQQLSAALEAAGHRCWIAPRDVKPGVPYPGQIVTAIEGSSGLVLLVTPSANDSPDVLQEVQLASTARKTIAPVIVSGCAPGPDLRYYLGVRHQIPWSDARGTTAELLRSFPAQSGDAWKGWAPEVQADPAPVKANKRIGDALRKLVEYSSATVPALEACDVFMIAHGPNKINVIKVIREYTGLGLAETKTMIENGFPPIRIAHQMPRGRAEALAKDLTEQGAQMMNPVASKT